jgi:hypothetical protein
MDKAKGKTDASKMSKFLTDKDAVKAIEQKFKDKKVD